MNRHVTLLRAGVVDARHVNAPPANECTEAEFMYAPLLHSFTMART